MRRHLPVLIPILSAALVTAACALLPTPPATPAAAGTPASHQAPPLITATVQAPAHITREVRSAVAIRLIHPVQSLDGAVEVHAGGRDAEPQPDQQEPRLRPQPSIREIPDAEPDGDTREEHGAETDELGGLSR